jgi:hypothetical protein
MWGDYLISERIFIEVVLPPTARFQISSEQLNCRRETAPMSWGSDEVGIKIFSIPIFTDLTIGEPQEPNDGKPIRRGDVDTGEHRPMDYLLFSHQQPIIGLAIGIRGYEVDGEDAFEKEIEDWQDAFVEILKVEIEFLKSYWGLLPAGGIGYLLGSLGLLTTAIAVAIAAAIILAIDLFIALWAPADLIIEDTIGPIVLDLARLTNVNVPKPLPSKYTSPQGIKVEVHPLEKIAHQYREMRRYINEDEDSVYEIELRYNRVA